MRLLRVRRGTVYIAELLVPAIDYALVMFGVLQIAFGQNQIAGGRCILGQSKVFFANLMRRAANSYVRPVAVEYLVAVICTTPRAVVMPAIVAVVAFIAGASVR